MGVTRGREGNGAQGPRTEGVGRVIVLEQLNIAAEFQAHTVVVGGANAIYDSGGAERVRDAMFPRKLIEAADGIGDHVADHETRQTTERHPVGTSAKALLNCAD